MKPANFNLVMKISFIILNLPTFKTSILQKSMSNALFSNLFLPLTLAIITLGLGLSISVQDIRNIVKYPKNVLVGLFSQLVLLPLIALFIAYITGLEEVYAVGLVLIAICPGGATANLVNYMIRGNVALSVSITVLNGLITIFTIPFLTSLALILFCKNNTEISIAIPDAVLKIFLLTILPASVGIFIRMKNERFAKGLETPLRYILPVLLLMVYSGVLFFESSSGVHLVWSEFFFILPFALSLNVLAMLAGYFVPALFNVNKQNKFTIAVEVGLQNSTLAIFVAGSLLDNYAIAMVPVVYGSFSFFSTWGLGYFARKYLS